MSASNHLLGWDTHVEVGQNDKQAPILGPKHVLSRHLDIVEGDVCRPSRGRVGRLDLLGLDVVSSRDEEDGQATIGLWDVSANMISQGRG